MKTKVLELEQKVLNFVEFEPLNEVELKETEGGFWGSLGGGFALYLLVSSIEYPQDFVDGFLGRK